MKRSARQARANNILDDLACLRTANSPGSWRYRLEQYAEKGYPTGSDGVGGCNEINRPTERMALMPDTPPAQKLKRLEEIEQALAELAREYHSIYQWTVNSAKYDGPEPRACVNLECTHEISMIGNDRATYGLCRTCYMREYRKQKQGLPNLIEKRAS